MSYTTFRFRQFSVLQNDAVHKVGTDGVLLGAWANLENAKSVLDVGTGTGLLALMAAQRTSETCIITGIDADPESAALAEENFRQSPWNARLKAMACRLQDFIPDSPGFDHILCNPPFFVNSLLPPNPGRQRQRHSGELSFQDLSAHCFRLLNAEGSLSVILPETESREVEQLALTQGFFLRRESSVQPKFSKPVHRRLLTFRKTAGDLDSGSLLLSEEDATKTVSHQELTAAFYL